MIQLIGSGKLVKGICSIPGRGVETKTSGSACYNGDFAFEREYVLKVFELDLGFCFGCHLGTRKWQIEGRNRVDESIDSESID